jgi:hypothetical protein
MQVRLEPGLEFLRRKDLKVYKVLERLETGVKCTNEAGQIEIVSFGEDIETDIPKYVKNAGDGLPGYIGTVNCARCGKTGSIHKGGGNMCQSCVSQI